VLALAAACFVACAASPPPLPAPLTTPSAPPPPRAPIASAEPAPPPPPAEEALAKSDLAAVDEPKHATTDTAPPPPPAAPRLTSQGYVTWVYSRPRADEHRFLGYIRYGTSVALRSTGTVRGENCPGGFYQVEPRGFVCKDRTVTLAPTPAFLAQAAATAPSPGPFPYRYALSNGTPMYNRVPTPDEARRRENPFGPAGKWQPLYRTLAAHEDLASPEPIVASGETPPFLTLGGLAAEGRIGLERQVIPLGSMLSFTRAFTALGRTWLLSADQTIVPADRVRAFRPSAFHGTRLGVDVSLPLAWIRGKSRPSYHRNDTGALEQTTPDWPLRSHVALTGASITDGGTRYLETRSRDAKGSPLYLAEADATVIDLPEKPRQALRPGKKTIYISITQGTLVAYEGLTPVFTTLISPGAGGVPIKGRDPVHASTTPLGTYTITFKDRAATMSPEKGDNRSFWIADVPYTQYFNPPFALHASYWHERFGEPTSAGCVNLSPVDAQTMFEWSDPPVPADWQGATGAGAPENGLTTTIVVTR
jgi:lipoprotein-anchoring transpeptidase ErfK/SrfK